jgi:hypothetical protein
MCAGDCADQFDDEFDLDPSNMVPRHEAEGLAASAYEDGRRAERVRIVEWLRDKDFFVLASRIEGGEA